MPSPEDIYRAQLRQRELDQFLDLFTADEWSALREAGTEIVHAHHANGAPVVKPTPSPEELADPVIPVRLQFKRSDWLLLAESYAHYFDHNCYHGAEVLDDFVGKVFDVMVPWLVDNGHMAELPSELYDYEDEEDD